MLLSAHDLLSYGRSCTMTLHPGGASGIFSKLDVPHSWLYANSFGLILEGRTMFSVITACLINLSHWLAV